MRPAVEPNCEICGTARAIIFAPTNGQKKPNDWKVICKKCNTHQEYFLFISDYYRSQRQQEDWIQHLSENTWFDIIDFGDMLKRYQHEWERAREF
jgi:hypothetical protein